MMENYAVVLAESRRLREKAERELVHRQALLVERMRDLVRPKRPQVEVGPGAMVFGDWTGEIVGR
jgi:hypothetical protein